jgi:hypothetical protein
MKILNDAGEQVGEASSDAEAVRWFHEQGRLGDHIENGEELGELSQSVFPDIAVRYDRDGCVEVEPRKEE